ncbi:unnamed protein product [Ceratitis capitata]|uniref:(Mediterranean fruit fly) hypothetical protein n=1 Tax=Ceratitis capitata TaxID=7213 RepID=A0A811V936_CERCA|nr:unnamed protein product [Ceratitis capitata]
MTKKRILKNLPFGPTPGGWPDSYIFCLATYEHMYNFDDCIGFSRSFCCNCILTLPCLRSKSLSTDFYSRLGNALVNDFNRNSENVEENLALNDYDDGDDIRDLDYVLDGDASDVENELVIEPNEILDSD